MRLFLLQKLAFLGAICLNDLGRGRRFTTNFHVGAQMAFGKKYWTN
jgi:hypothetical protein